MVRRVGGKWVSQEKGAVAVLQCAGGEEYGDEEECRGGKACREPGWV